MCDLGSHVSSINHCLLLPVPRAAPQLLGKFDIRSEAPDGSSPLGERATSTCAERGGKAGFCPVPLPLLLSFLRQRK